MSDVVGGPLQSVPEEPPFDPADRSLVADPYPVFAAMRRKLWFIGIPSWGTRWR